jgi:hypothetical protein
MRRSRGTGAVPERPRGGGGRGPQRISGARARGDGGLCWAAVSVEMRDVAAGLWLWRQPHPDWREGFDWEPAVASFAVESRGTAVVLDPLAPAPGARDVWARLDALRPEAVVVLKPDHVRDVDLFVRWYGARAYGPYLVWRDDIPHCDLEPVRPGDELPGGLQAHSDGRGQMETPPAATPSAPWRCGK